MLLNSCSGKKQTQKIASYNVASSWIKDESTQLEIVSSQGWPGDSTAAGNLGFLFCNKFEKMDGS